MIDRAKARFAAKGHSKVKGVDYLDVLAFYRIKQV